MEEKNQKDMKEEMKEEAKEEAPQTRQEKKEAKKENKLSNKLKEEIDELLKKIDTLNSDKEKLAADINHWKNEYYKAYADTENLRKSIEKDHREALKYRAEGFIDNLLPVLDGFHLALNGEVKSEEVKNYLVGFSYIYNNFVKVLEDEGVTEVSPKINDKYDPMTMQAIETIYDEGEPNRVLKINFKGYKLKDRLIRPAMVVVSTNIKKEEKSVDEKNNESCDEKVEDKETNKNIN